jgi:hypothetical protein
MLSVPKDQHGKANTLYLRIELIQTTMVADHTVGGTKISCAEFHLRSISCRFVPHSTTLAPLDTLNGRPARTQ